ncbi:hypothetical protein DLD82_11490 [Methanospirillum stamsii]|uniref:Uncharacterized protein n=1 Tax=Methanospirillum stamsii TaxID=1277351 RepID=A0A2V2N9Y1_9EURY|nr:hypothetical protein DLD82_11490 [Methanospirillum stamsii]
MGWKFLWYFYRANFFLRHGDYFTVKQPKYKLFQNYAEIYPGVSGKWSATSRRGIIDPVNTSIQRWDREITILRDKTPDRDQA